LTEQRAGDRFGATFVTNVSGGSGKRKEGSLSVEEPTHHADVRDLARFGHPQELRRMLGVYSSFAVAFSYISPSTGIFTLYALGLGIGGPAFIWTWPIVIIGQLIVGLNFAELSSHFPVAGSVYQWTKYLAGKNYAWFTGWIYLFAGVLTICAVDVTIPIVIIPLLNGLPFGININPSSTSAQIVVAVITLVSTTLLNVFGVRLVAIVNNTGVVFVILGMVVFALVLLIFFSHHSPAVIMNGHALSATGLNPFGAFMVAMFMSLFVVFGFDTASTLAEETKNPRREAPRAVLAAIIGAAVIGATFLFATLLAIPGDVDKYVAKVAAGTAAPPVDIIQQMPAWAAELYLFVVAAAIYVCCLAIQTSTIRLAFGMARDGKLPLGRVYNKVSPTLHTPVGTCIVVGALAGIPLFYYAGAGAIAIQATGLIYLSYLLCNIAVLRARLKVWPTEAVPFKLGGWGLVINILALLWGGSMLVSFLWPRGGIWVNTFINPKISELPNIPNLGPLGGVPLFEATLGVILIVGFVYWLFAQRSAPDVAPIKPAEMGAPA
jgi:urea carboxylase system permease